MKSFNPGETVYKSNGTAVTVVGHKLDGRVVVEYTSGTIATFYANSLSRVDPRVNEQVMKVKFGPSSITYSFIVPRGVDIIPGDMLIRTDPPRHQRAGREGFPTVLVTDIGGSPAGFCENLVRFKGKNLRTNEDIT